MPQTVTTYLLRIQLEVGKEYYYCTCGLSKNQPFCDGSHKCTPYTPMKFKAEINVMPHKELLDPQGKTVARNMDHVGITGVQDVRIGKRIEIALEAADENAARTLVDQACQKFLANMIMENYSFEIKAV